MKKVLSLALVLFLAAAVSFSCSKPASSGDAADSSSTKGDSPSTEHPSDHPAGSEHPASSDTSKIINMEHK